MHCTAVEHYVSASYIVNWCWFICWFLQSYTHHFSSCMNNYHKYNTQWNNSWGINNDREKLQWKSRKNRKKISLNFKLNAKCESLQCLQPLRKNTVMLLRIFKQKQTEQQAQQFKTKEWVYKNVHGENKSVAAA